MGFFVDYHCQQCRYEATDIAVGRGRNPYPYLALYRCARCKTVGSTWIEANQPARCGTCYEPGVELLSDDVVRVDCPRCGTPARFTRQEGNWE